MQDNEKFQIVYEQEAEKAVLVGLITKNDKEEKIEEYLDELAFLATTAGAVTKKRFTQNLSSPDPKTFIGKGKLEEIRDYVQKNDIDIVIFDDDLSPSQQNNIEKMLKCKVLDRTRLILDIFAGRAQTAQARAQVELAQMEYLLPRLKGMWTHLERQKGGIGMRGPGEKEIETDRRIIQDKIALLKKKLEKIEKQSITQRKSREQMIRVALVGYTNVGKSTIMNLLSKSEVFAENKLFATLDTTVRKVVVNRVPFLLSDTVGFIRKLPHGLVESFKSTLDEAREADILIHVVDMAHPNFEEHIKVVKETLKDIGVAQKPTILTFNKLDLYRKKNFDKLLPLQEQNNILRDIRRHWSRAADHCVLVSAETGENVDELKHLLFEEVKKLYLERYPYKAYMF